MINNNREGNDTDNIEMALIKYEFIAYATVPHRRSTPIATVALGAIKLIVLCI